MGPTRLLLIGLLATTGSAVWASDGSERPRQVRDTFLASQEQIHGNASQQTAAAGTGTSPRDAGASATTEEDI
ncbi:hypothetical protein KHO49_24990 [Pseudomonas sp. RC4D1]|uniref:hypothetical protein n=1 Tax=Pseudomonas TaxID=286 RepID=UPI001BCC299A|nr:MULTISPECIES: hypothetical protein [unclassified Pseudomonas]MBS7561596.1 hypothetical protein [Pseudomonas sp. RC4D1]MBW8357556.1 hypothetical protein [Pseudomonas sp.]